MYFGSNLRCQLGAIDQVLQWVAAAEFIQQPRQVADYSCWVRGVNIPWDVPNLHQRHVPIGIGPIGCADLRGEMSRPCHFPPAHVNKEHDEDIDPIKNMLWCLCILYHQAVTAGLQGAEADAEQDRSGKGVVVYEAATLGVTVVTV